MSKPTIPGLVRPVAQYRPWQKQAHSKRSIEEKRQVIIRAIERHRRRDKGAISLEGYDPEQKAPVIRVLYGNIPLPIFDGQPLAFIDPQADREQLWGAIIERIQAGAYDAQIEAAAGDIYRKTLKPKKAA